MIGRNARNATDAEIVAEYAADLERFRRHGAPEAMLCRYGTVAAVTYVTSTGVRCVSLLHDPGIGSMFFGGTHVPAHDIIDDAAVTS